MASPVRVAANVRRTGLVRFNLWQCAGCRHQASVTAETVLHRTKTPLTVWFWAAYLMTTDKRGLSVANYNIGLNSGIF
jgi:hypothetical protein